MTDNGLHLSYFPVASTWGFTFGDVLVRLEDVSGGFPLFYREREDAVRAADDCGLDVDEKGNVSVQP